MSKSSSTSTIAGLLVVVFATYGIVGFLAGALGHALFAGVLVSATLAYSSGYLMAGSQKSKPQKNRLSKAGGSAKRQLSSSSDDRESISQRYTVDESEFSIKPPDRKVKDCTFHRGGESVKFKGYTLPGLVYTGRCRRHAYGEPAIIDPDLPVKHSDLTEPLGYWPDYAQLSEGQRAQYLSWLANGRGPIEELGYVFLFLYGLERYVYRDAGGDDSKVREETLKHIVKEVRRLRGIFAENRSFDSYTTNLLDAIYVKFWPHRLEERKKGLPSRSPIAATFTIVRQANEVREQPLDADWALQWVLGYGGVSRTKAVRENYPLIRVLFRQAYEAATKGGIRLPTCKRRAMLLEFHPSAQGLDDVARHKFPTEWFNPIELKRPLTQLEKIYGDVMPTVRKLSKALATKQLLEILNVWPVGTPMGASPHLQSIVKSVQSFLAKRDSLTAYELSRLFLLPPDTKLTNAMFRKVASALATCGYAVAPDPSIAAVTFKPDDAVRVYKGPRVTALSPEAGRAATAIRLGAILALADGELHDHEVAVLKKRADSHGNALERQYLHHYVDWNLTQTRSAAGLKKQIEQLDNFQRDELADLLVKVAQADGALPKTEIKELEKLFTRLGLESSGVTERLHSAAVNQISKSQPGAKVSTAHPDSGVEIDLKSLEAHASSTREVQSVLSRIFEEDAVDDTLADGVEEVSSLVSDAWHEGRLDDAHGALAEWLLTGDEWSMEQVTQKCNELGLMTEGALSEINETAFETLGDSLIELGDSVEVYRDVMPA